MDLFSLLKNLSALATGIFFFTAAPAAYAEMQGDKKAIALANEMIVAMGGHQVWSGAVWMQVRERSYAPSQKRPLNHEAWRGLQVQQARYRTANEDVTYIQAWDMSTGWRVLNGEYRQFDEARQGQERDFWHREIYTMYHRFAVGDPSLRLILTEERGFRVEHAEKGDPLGSFTVAADGGVLVWSSGDSSEDVTYVYGPLKSFGEINLPEWGAQTNGDWRFNYLEAELHYEPMPADIMTP